MPRSSIPEIPRDLIRDTNDLLVTLEHTLTNLRDFTDKLHAATAKQRLDGGTVS